MPPPGLFHALPARGIVSVRAWPDIRSGLIQALIHISNAAGENEIFIIKKSPDKPGQKIFSCDSNVSKLT